MYDGIMPATRSISSHSSQPLRRFDLPLGLCGGRCEEAPHKL